jgi:uncharacterized RDD family membrane protein YckC
MATVTPASLREQFASLSAAELRAIAASPDYSAMAREAATEVLSTRQATAPTHPCPVHADAQVVGTCERCGAFICLECDPAWARFKKGSCGACQQLALGRLGGPRGGSQPTPGAVGPCLEHPELMGPACARCGTFRCAACLVEGRCPACRDERLPRPPLPAETVGFGRRARARALDVFLGQAASMVAGVAAGVVLMFLKAAGLLHGRWQQGFRHGAVIDFVVGVVPVLLGAAWATWLCGASPGKLLLGLRTVHTDGTRVGFKAALLREVAFLVDALFFGLMAWKVMGSSPLNQRNGDRLADTVVVYAHTLPASVAGSTSQALAGVAAGLVLQGLVLGALIVIGAFW